MTLTEANRWTTYVDRFFSIALDLVTLDLFDDAGFFGSDFFNDADLVVVDPCFLLCWICLVV